MLRGWSHEQAVLGAPLMDPESGAEDLRAVLAWLRGQYGLAGALLLPWIDENTPAAAALASASPVRLDLHDRAALRPAADAPASIGAKKRKEFGRLRRRLAEQGHLESLSATTPDAVEHACAAFAELEARGWKGRRGSAFAQDPARLAFLHAVTQGLARQGACRIDRLTLDGETIAAGIVLGGGPRALYWKTTYDEHYGAFSPGVLLTLDITARQAADPAVLLTDSCALADHPMIERIWADRIAIADWWIPLGPTSAALLAAERARRALRAAAKRLLRRSLAPRPQFAADDLAGGGHRQVRHEGDLARIFVGREPLLHEALDVGGQRSGVSATPRFSTTKAFTISVRSASGLPTAAASATPGGGSGNPRSRPARCGSRTR